VGRQAAEHAAEHAAPHAQRGRGMSWRRCWLQAAPPLQLKRQAAAQTGCSRGTADAAHEKVYASVLYVQHMTCKETD
jgi:hypothetical protein